MPPAPATPAHTPIARSRSSAGNVEVIIDNVAGMIIAAVTRNDPRRQQGLDRPRRGRRQVRNDEEAQSTDQQLLAAEPVADGSERQQQRCQRDPCSR